MKISVALASFNGGRFLREQLDSIRRQSLLPNEVVISDDGSTDDTVALARQFATEVPCKVVIDADGPRLGFTQNFVRAIRQCTGDIVALCDQDDVWDEHKLAVASAAFADEAVTTVTHRVRVVDEHLNPTALIEPAAPYQGEYTLFSIDPWFSPNGMQMLFRRSAIVLWLDRTPPLSAYGHGTTPFDEWIFFLGTLTGTAVLLPDILGVWRRHDASLTRNVQSIQEENTTTHNLQLALHSGAETYAFRAEITDSRAEFVEDLGVGTPAPVPRAAGFYREISRMFRRRVRLHDPKGGHFRRLQTFLSMAAHKDYRSKDRGGLGAKAILKDGFTVCFGPRRELE